MTGRLVVRQARDDELEAAGALVADAYLTQPGMDPASPYLTSVRDARRRAVDCPVLVAADADGTLLGCVTYVPDRANPYAELEEPGEAGFRMLGVVADARGRGVGEALVTACVERARAAGRRGLAISTSADWTAARRLYERLGFRHAAERDFEPVPGIHLLAYVRDL